MRGGSTASGWVAKNTIPQGQPAVRTLTDVLAPSPTDLQVLTYIAAANKWEPMSPVAGIATFPIIYTDGTYTYEVTVAAPGELEIRVFQNSNPAGNFSYIQFNQSDIAVGNIRDVTFVNGRNFNVASAGNATINPTGNVAISPSGNASISPTGTLILKAVTVDPTGGSTGDVLTKQAGGSLALQTPAPSSAADDALLWMGIYS